MNNRKGKFLIDELEYDKKLDFIDDIENDKEKD